ncbi:MAG: hypothetical protein WD023_08610 [Ilumatobacteraceae bacterium]
MSTSGHLAHLARRFVGSLSTVPPSVQDERWAESHLLAHERSMWRTMSNADRRHATQVARRFVDRRPDAPRAEMAGALLHDVGKVACGLGTFGRVAATVVGPRTDRFRRYHDHERIGADALAAGGSDACTVALVRRSGPAAHALDQADDV